VTTDKPPAGTLARGAVAGVLAAGLALGAAQLVAGLISSTSSPVVAVGQLSIDLTPPAVKNFAISAFGSHDKIVLVGGILVVLAIFAAGVGILAVRRLSWGMAGLGLFVVVGLIAALTRPGSSVSDLWPTVIGGAAGALALRRLVHAAAARPTAVAPAGTGRALPGYIAPPPTQPRGTQPPVTQPPADQPPVTQPPADQPRAGRPDPWDEPELWDRQPDPWDDQPHRPGGAGSGAGRPPAGPLPGPQRRTFITTSAVVAGTAVVAGLGGRLLAERGNVSAARKTLRIPAPARPAPPLPAGADLKIPGLSSFITPNSTFYRVDTAIVLPEITPTAWQLRIHGMVAREITLTFDDLIKRPLIEEYITLTCVSNEVGGSLVGNARWLGASLRSLLRQAGIRAGAEQLLCRSADGFTNGSPVQVAMDGRDSMLAVAMNGTALPVQHGFPVRMVVPGLYGYVSACKWITDIEVTTYQASRAYWAQRGWDQQAPIKTESRIDVPGGNQSLPPGTHQVAGVAWAQHKGIEAVEVRVDKGPWHQARLAAVPDIDTWRQWVWDWQATPGTHLIESRATDKTGYTQTAQEAPPEPNGSTGYPQLAVQIRS
jgi:DMSO/TMAO reductase YedYZ molybdopterin-dependent catalytic subunit